MSVLQLVIPENIHIPVPTDRENLEGERQIKCVKMSGGDVEANLCKG